MSEYDDALRALTIAVIQTRHGMIHIPPESYADDLLRALWELGFAVVRTSRMAEAEALEASR